MDQPQIGRAANKDPPTKDNESMNKTNRKKKQPKSSRKKPVRSRVPATSTKRLTVKGKSAGGKRNQSPKARSGKQKTARKTTVPLRPIPPPLPPRKPTAEQRAYQNALRQFESAVRLLSGNQLAKARSLFERLTAVPTPDLAQRARIYLAICNQRLSKPSLQLKTADDYYNYGVRMSNQRNLEEAEENLRKAIKLAPKSDYIYYALASTSALRENAESALENLGKAIQLNMQNRYLAQNDPDFASLGEDPRFTELIYPEKPPAP